MPFGGDGNWHKIGISFQRDKIVAYHDCKLVNELEFQGNKAKIKTDGTIYIGGKYPDSGNPYKVSIEENLLF